MVLFLNIEVKLMLWIPLWAFPMSHQLYFLCTQMSHGTLFFTWYHVLLSQSSPQHWPVRCRNLCCPKILSGYTIFFLKMETMNTAVTEVIKRLTSIFRNKSWLTQCYISCKTFDIPICKTSVWKISAIAYESVWQRSLRLLCRKKNLITTGGKLDKKASTKHTAVSREGSGVEETYFIVTDKYLGLERRLVTKSLCCLNDEDGYDLECHWRIS